MNFTTKITYVLFYSKCTNCINCPLYWICSSKFLIDSFTEYRITTSFRGVKPFVYNWEIKCQD